MVLALIGAISTLLPIGDPVSIGAGPNLRAIVALPNGYR